MDLSTVSIWAFLFALLQALTSGDFASLFALFGF